MIMGKVQRKVNRHLYAMQGTTVGYTGVIAAYAVVLLQSKHLNATEIGIAIALCSAFGIFLQPLVAAFSNRHRNVSLKTIMAFLDLISLVGAAALYFATSPLVLVIVIFVVTSSISTSMLTFIGAYAMEFENRGMRVNFGISRGIGSLAYALIGFVMGQIVDLYGPKTILPAFAIILILATIMTARHITPEQAMPTPVSEDIIEDKPSVKVKARDLIKGKPCMILLFLALFCISYNHTALDSYQVNIVQELNGSTGNYGTVMMIMGLCEIPSLFLCNRLMRRFGCGNMITAAMIAFLIKDVLLITAQDVSTIYVAQICNLSTVGMYMPAMVYFINELVDPGSNVSAQAFFVGVGTGLGRVLGNVAGGALIDAGGTFAMLISNIAVIAVGLLLMRSSLAVMHKKGIMIR